MKKYLEPILHILIWVLGYYMLAVLSTSAGSFRQGEGPYEAAVLFGTIMNMVVFYATAFFLFPRLFQSKKRMLPTLLLILGFLGLCLLESYFDYTFVASFFSANNARFSAHVLQNMLVGFVVLLASLSYALFTNWVANEKLKRVLLEEKLSTEMAFLKSKINPHFLFNVLNSFYAKTLKHQVPELSEGLLKLAELTRYMVYETNEDKVLLEREIRHLKNFIEVCQLRISDEDDVQIDFDVIGNIDSVKICPLLLIPFVENAIKHGINVQGKSEIKIQIEIKQQMLYFKVINPIVKVTNGIVDHSSGFGLDNLRTRLSILYPNTHTIATTTENGNFVAFLSLELN